MSNRASFAALLLAAASLLMSCSTSGADKPDEPSTGEQPASTEVEEDEEDEEDEADAPELPEEETVGDIEPVALFNEMMLTGVTVSEEGRIFVNFPRWGDEVPFTVAEIVDGEPKPFPNEAINKFEEPYAEHFVSVQSVVVGPNDDLWVLDTGSPQFKTPVENGPKLVRIDLDTNEVAETILIGDAALDTTYLNDVRFDMRRGEGGMAFITDSSSTGGIIVVDLAAKKSWRKLSDHPATAAEEKFLPIVEGQPMMRRPEGKPAGYLSTGSDGIALSPDGKRLFFRPLAGRGLFSVSTDALADPELSDEKTAETLTEHGNLGFASDGIIYSAGGDLYLTNYEDNGVVRRSEDGELETIVHDPRALWPDTLAIGPDGYLYFTANQLHRQPSFHNGEDLREKPYVLFRVDVGAKPVQLRK